MSNVREAHGEAVVEALCEERRCPLHSIKRSKAFPNSALSAAVENLVAVKSDGRKGPLGMVISTQMKRASRSRLQNRDENLGKFSTDQMASAAWSVLVLSA